MGSNLSLILAVCYDSGIIYVPEACVAGELARNQLEVIDGYTDPETLGVYALYPHRHAAMKVRVLVDFIKSRIPAVASPDSWCPSDGIMDERNIERHSSPGQEQAHAV